MGQPDFGRPTAHPTPPVAHALYDDDADVVDRDVAKAVDELKPALPLGCRWRVPLTRVHNPYGVLLLYRDQLNAHTHDQVMAYVNVNGSIVN